MIKSTILSQSQTSKSGTRIILSQCEVKNRNKISYNNNIFECERGTVIAAYPEVHRSLYYEDDGSLLILQ